MRERVAHYTPVIQDPINDQLTGFEKDRIAYHVAQHGHQGIYHHHCPCCGMQWDCDNYRCRKTEESECKDCFAAELHEDTRRICTAITIARSVNAEQLGWLKGLADRAQELERWNS